MIIQPRDVKLLHSLFCHRYLTTEHLHGLHFEGRTPRAAQSRLKELLDDNYVLRTYVMPPVDGVRRSVRPLYSIARAGADVLRTELGIPIHRIPHTSAGNRVGYEQLLHELLVADFLVSVEVMLRGHPGIASTTVARDHDLRRTLAGARRELSFDDAVVPDGAITVDADTLPSPTTLYLEVVHAAVKGGNRRFIDKLERYARLIRSGFFAQVFRHGRVRAVVVVSFSPERADNLRKLAATRLVHGRRLVWFAAAPRHLSRTHPPTTFTHAAIAAQDLVDVDGTCHRVTIEELR